MASWTDKFTLSRTLKIWSIFFVLFIVSCKAELTGEDLKNIEALNVQKMLQHQIKGDAKDQIRKGKRIFVNETTPDERNVHPYMRKGIIREVLQFYSKYREMIFVRGGTFWRGTNDPQSKTGEYPLRKVTVKNFYLDANPVINAAYWAFRKAKKFFITDAEKKGWSWVVDMFLSDETREYYSMPGTRGWAAVKNADWNAPEGPDSNLEDRWNHPVVHVSWYDAKMFCEFHGKRLPSEAEWEYAVKIGVTSHAYPWGDNWERRRANVWQGKWPTENKKIDGYSITSPVDAYRPQNLVGFYDMIGNVWEWTSSAYVERSVQPHSKMVVLKGGSYVDSVSGEINYPVRNGQRIGQKQDYTAANVGFRCAKTMPEYVPLPQATESPVVQKLKKMKRRKFHRRRKDEL
uniref:Sulfatase-modifying factor enzyme-like domain-containing protein n=1 Tax=Arion vulgaris TaxID=1028688 RepID=A0A0B7AIE1_9EUPU